MRQWIWVIWLIALLIAPVGLVVVNAVYPTIPSYPPPWPAEPSAPERLASGLFIWHLVASAAAATAVPMRSRSWSVRLAGLVGIAGLVCGMGVFTLMTVMAKTGKYL
jgi:hypothetical protein